MIAKMLQQPPSKVLWVRMPFKLRDTGTPSWSNEVIAFLPHILLRYYYLRINYKTNIETNGRGFGVLGFWGFVVNVMIC